MKVYFFLPIQKKNCTFAAKSKNSLNDEKKISLHIDGFVGFACGV